MLIQYQFQCCGYQLLVYLTGYLYSILQHLVYHQVFSSDVMVFLVGAPFSVAPLIFIIDLIYMKNHICRYCFKTIVIPLNWIFLNYKIITH